jgi:hypothetical protein
MNPFAVVFWLICTAFGWLAGGTKGAVLGFAISASMSLVITILERK